MGSIVSAITGISNGNGSRDAQSANILNPATVEQANQQYGNVQSGVDQQQAFVNALNQQNGLGNQSSVFNQLQGVANGTGPNPAQAMLANSTGQNVANQAALMAGQRGAGANVGMLARQAAQQGAGIQQNAAGQGAAMQAQQSLGALGQMGGLANQQAAQQQAGLNAYNQAAQGAQGQTLGAIAGQNNANVGMQSNVNNNNNAMAQTNAQMGANIFGGVMNGVGAAMDLIPKGATGLFAEGGQIPKVSGPKSKVGQHFHGLAQGGPVPALVSPGEKYLDPKDVQQVEKGAKPMQVGKTVPGTPKVKGAKNSYANDTVPATLEEGGIVIPRSITQGKNPEKKAAEFVAAILKKQSLKGK